MSLRQLSPEEETVVNLLRAMYKVAKRREKALREKAESYKKLYPVLTKRKRSDAEWSKTFRVVESKKFDAPTIYTLSCARKTGKWKRHSTGDRDLCWKPVATV